MCFVYVVCVFARACGPVFALCALAALSVAFGMREGTLSFNDSTCAPRQARGSMLKVERKLFAAGSRKLCGLICIPFLSAPIRKQAEACKAQAADGRGSKR